MGSMTKAFRNTGIEGGYGSLATQNWLLGLRRSINRAGRVTGERADRFRHATQSSKFDPPVKTIDNPFRGRNTLHLKALMLKYAEIVGPTIQGTWNKNIRLQDAGFIRMVTGPNCKQSNGRNQPPSWLGATFEITDKGRAYVKQLMARN